MTPQERLEAYRERLRKMLAEMRDLHVGGRRLGDVRPADLGLDPTHLGAWLGDLRVAVAFFTRLPVAGPPVDGAAVARAAWAAPLVGALIGALSGLAFFIAWRLNLPPFCCATLAVGTSLALTGALHEDGLADMADGFGGQTRVGALANLPNPALAVWALIGAHAAARAGLPLFMALVPPARPDGLSASAGAPSGAAVAIALAIGLLALGKALGLRNALVALVLMLAAGLMIGVMAWRRIGGQTGDVLGAVEQTGECLVLLVAAAVF